MPAKTEILDDYRKQVALSKNDMSFAEMK